MKYQERFATEFESLPLLTASGYDLVGTSETNISGSSEAHSDAVSVSARRTHSRKESVG